jgi:hypothetical protein
MSALPPYTALKPNKARRAEKNTDRGKAPGANGHPTLLAAPVTLALMKKPCCRESEACENLSVVKNALNGRQCILLHSLRTTEISSVIASKLISPSE